MQYSIIHDGRRIGVLETRREGAYTRFEARCAFLPGIRRLFLCGGGRSAALGVMQPEGGALVLRRRFSRAAMRAFPAPVEFAAFEGKTEAAPPPESARAEKKTTDAEPLYLTEEGVRYLALPCALRQSVPGARVREIGEESYLLFRTCE